MKFNWGTGIFTFIIIFLLLCVAFIIFTVRQGVNLVHDDYYEKGVDYSEELKVKQRSMEYHHAFEIIYLNKYLVLAIDENLSAQIDSGTILMFRPSDKKQDIEMPLEANAEKITFSKANLISGRYILKIQWYSNGEKFEHERPVNVQ